MKIKLLRFVPYCLIVGIFTSLSLGLTACSERVGVSPTVISLSSISIIPSSQINLKKGFTQQFTATGTYSDGSTTDITSQVTWESDKSWIATIQSNGIVEGEAVGTANITATFSGITSQIVPLTVIPLSSISIFPSSQLNLKIGSTQQFTAMGTYSDGSTADITSQVIWEIDNPTIANVQSGLVTGDATGTTNITAALSGITSTNVTLNIETSVMIYLDSNYTESWDSTNIPDLDSISWGPDTSETGSPYTWKQGILTVYLWNTGQITFSVDAQDYWESMTPGFSVHSDTITLQPGQKSPLDIITEWSPVAQSLSGDSQLSVWFNIQPAN